jgi:hypothetical protein
MLSHPRPGNDSSRAEEFRKGIDCGDRGWPGCPQCQPSNGFRESLWSEHMNMQGLEGLHVCLVKALECPFHPRNARLDVIQEIQRLRRGQHLDLEITIQCSGPGPLCCTARPRCGPTPSSTFRSVDLRECREGNSSSRTRDDSGSLHFHLRTHIVAK